MSEKPGSTPNLQTRTALNHILGSIEQRQTHNPARYQTLWAQVVGPDAAQQSQLDRVDPATQTAWFRCTNSALSYSLGRKPALVQKLAKALKLPHEQVSAAYMDRYLHAKRGPA